MVNNKNKIEQYGRFVMVAFVVIGTLTISCSLAYFFLKRDTDKVMEIVSQTGIMFYALSFATWAVLENSKNK